jgi:PAS domain S-box-containing protein
MPLSTARFPADSTSLDPFGAAPDVLRDLLDVSLTGIIFYTPVYDSAGELVDFAFIYLNPTAQRMMGMPARPTATHMQQWPQSKAHGMFQFHAEAFESGEPREYNVNYQADGYDNYYRLAARRSGQGLLVSFTDTADQPRTAVEVALREAQAVEQTARAETDAQRQRLYGILEQFPAVVASYRGPNHVFELISQRFQQSFPARALKGRPIREALPELAGQGYFEILDDVYRTGEPFYGTEMETWVDPSDTGELEQRYYNVFFQATRAADGSIDGILNFAYDVSEQVRARQQVQQLNQELETRVQQRTQEALMLQADLLAAAQRQAQDRQAFQQIFEQTPALIALLRAPGHRFEYVNQAYQTFFAGRQLVGLDFAEALPDAWAQGYVELLNQVFRTGETYFGTEVPFAITLPGGETRTSYFNFTYQAYREDGLIAGISVFAYDVSEQVRARQQREAERQRLQRLFREAPAGICILAGPDLVFEFVNPRYQQLLPGRALQGLPIWAALPELAGTAVETLLHGVYETGQTHEAQGLLVPMVRPSDGMLENRYFTFIYQARRDEQERVDGVLVFVFEVTEQVVARQKAEESHEELKWFKFMADQARDAFILMREDGSFAYLNQKALEAWGYSEEEGRQLHVSDIDALYQYEGFAQLFAQAQSYSVPQLETRHRRKDGHVFPVEVGVAGLRLGGQPHLLAVARDITAQKQTTEALRESEERFRSMADAAPNQVWAVNPDSTVRYVNRAFLDFVGMELEDYLAAGWSAFMHPDELDGAQHVLEEAIRDRKLYSLEHRMLRHDGEYRWLLAQGAPSYYPNGDLYGYVGSAIDISELKQTNQQLTRTNIDLDTFIYTASHDLREPISNLEGLVQALEQQLPASAQQDPDVTRLLGMMRTSVARFQLTIAQLTDLAQLQQAQAQPTEAVDVAALVESVCQDLTPKLAATQTQLTVDVSAGSAVSFAPKHLRSIIYNLLSNAVKYRDSSRVPVVALRCYRAPGTFVLEVQDNGLGLDAGQQAKLFGLFERLHNHVEGTGIGLYMVKRMVENAGGVITVQSEPGVGSTFSVVLPD